MYIHACISSIEAWVYIEVHTGYHLLQVAGELSGNDLSSIAFFVVTFPR